MNGLDYGLAHSQIALISHLLLFKKGATSTQLIPKNSYADLLPETKKLDALHSLLWLSHILLASRANAGSFHISFENNGLIVQSPHLYLAREQLKNVVLPKNLTITLL
jgi:hypothetical protein